MFDSPARPKPICTAIVSLAAATALGAASPARAQTDVYLFGGQSNMWTHVRDAYMARQAVLTPDATLGSSFYAWGGRGLDAGWDWDGATPLWLGDTKGPDRDNFYAGLNDADPNIGNAYDNMITQWQADLAAIKGPYTIKGIVWVHGEQDGNGSTGAAAAHAYAENLAHLNDRIHEDLGLKAGSTPLLISELSTSFYVDSAIVKQQQVNAAAGSGHADAISNATLVGTGDLDFYDGRHYTVASRDTLGARLADSLAIKTASSPTISYWTLDEASGSFVDTVGLLGTNTLTRATATQNTASVASLLNPDASDSRGSNPASQTSLLAKGSHISALDLTDNGGWTLEGYFKTDSDARQFIVSNNPSGSGGVGGWNLELSNPEGKTGHLTFRVQGKDESDVNTSFLLTTSDLTLDDDAMHHFAVSWDPTAEQIALFVDGESAGTMELPLQSATESDRLFFIGGFLLNSGSFDASLQFDGELDELRLSAGVLSSDQFLNAPEPSSLLLLGTGGLCDLH